jgi:hypothetical protein
MDLYDDGIPKDDCMSQGSRETDAYLDYLRVRARGNNECGAPHTASEQQFATRELLRQELIVNDMATQAASAMLGMYYKLRDREVLSNVRASIRSHLVNRGPVTSTEIGSLSLDEARHLMPARMAAYKGMS